MNWKNQTLCIQHWNTKNKILRLHKRRNISPCRSPGCFTVHFCIFSSLYQQHIIVSPIHSKSLQRCSWFRQPVPWAARSVPLSLSSRPSAAAVLPAGIERPKASAHPSRFQSPAWTSSLRSQQWPAGETQRRSPAELAAKRSSTNGPGGHDLRRARPVPQPLLYDGGRAPIERRRPTTAATKYRHRDATFFYLPRAPPTSTQHVYLR
jgi:hypothetical protein